MNLVGASCEEEQIGKSVCLFIQAVMQSQQRCWRFQRILFLKKGSQRVLKQAVPQTNTGGLEEYSKAGERRRLKELGKQAGRKFARCPPAVRRAKLKFVSRLFIKNTGPCEGESQSIRADACPVPVS